MTPALAVRGLHKRYGTTVAVDGLDLEVERGGIVALVGPNGSGKTTTVECIEGLRAPDAGVIRVLGLDPQRDRDRLTQRVGVALQGGSLYEKLRVEEALWSMEPFYEATLPRAELLQAFGLADRPRAFFGELSGGQRQRLLAALAFIGDPELAILDEPTSGLDPHGRETVWAMLLQRREHRGTTLLVTTHQLDEAESFCDEVVLLDRGRLVTRGVPADLLRSHAVAQRIAFCANGGTLDPERARVALGGSHARCEHGRVVVYGDGDLAGPAARVVAEHGLEPPGFELRAGRLNDLFLLLTGHERGRL